MISARRHSFVFIAPVWLLASCSSGRTENPSSDPQALSAMASTQRTPSANSRTAPKDWRRAMSKIPAPKDGCFKVTYPSTTLVEVPCAKDPDLAGPLTVGDGIDQVSVEPGGISWAEGSFPSVSGVTSESDKGNANVYSLQLNTNLFATPACGGSCRGWQQLAYEGQGKAFIEYQLVGFGNNCPSGWNQQGTNCWKNSPKIPVPAEPITSLADLSLTGVAGSSDTLTFAVGNEVYTMSQPSVLGLNSQVWGVAEFNVFGASGGDQAVFQGSPTIVVQTVTDPQQPSGSPVCASSSAMNPLANLTGERTIWRSSRIPASLRRT